MLSWTPPAEAPSRSRALSILAPDEVALAASRVDAGVTAADRLSSMVAVIARLSRTYPVLAWQQGALGEAAVAGGAVGYECGIGWRERCDLPAAMRSRRNVPAPDGHPGARPVYIERLMRSIPKRSVEALLASSPSIAADLTCLDPACCPAGRRALLGDARGHAISSRLRTLAQVALAQPAWRWNHLPDSAHAGLRTATRINNFADQLVPLTKVDTVALESTIVLADNRRQTLRRRHVA